MSLLDRLGRRAGADRSQADAGQVVADLARDLSRFGGPQVEPVLVRLNREHAFPMRVTERPDRLDAR